MDEAANDYGARPSSTSPPEPSGQRPKRRCPICSRGATVEFSPFCSKRCADVDLHRWLGEGYRVPVETDDDMRDSPDAE